MNRKLISLFFALGLLSLYAYAHANSPVQGTIPASDDVYLPLIIKSIVTPPATATALPTATLTRVPTATHTPVPPTATPPATSQSQNYVCNQNFYNCSDFSTQSQAQAVFDYCQNLGFGDVHALDADHDGIACESLPHAFSLVK